MSRARRVIENAFGILVARWRVFKTEIACDPDNVEIITRAAVVLHNYMLAQNASIYCPPNFADVIDYAGRISQPGLWRQQKKSCFSKLKKPKSGRRADAANLVREQLAEYFCTEDALEWQRDWVNYDGHEDLYSSDESESE